MSSFFQSDPISFKELDKKKEKQKKRSKAFVDLLTEEALAAKLAQLKADGVKHYTMYQSIPQDLKAIKKARVYCLFVFLPMFVSIPPLVATGAIYKLVAAEKIGKTFILLNFFQFISAIYGLTAYNIINKIVTSIVYNVNDNTITIKWFGSWLLQEQEATFKPEELVKHYRKSFNIFVGYKSRRRGDGDLRFATEGINTSKSFLDRQLLDSLIYRPPKREEKSFPSILQ